MAQVCYSRFVEIFRSAVNDPKFGYERDELPRVKGKKAQTQKEFSPTADELRRAGVLDELQTEHFVREIFELIKEHRRLENQKPQILKHEKTIRRRLPTYGKTKRKIEQIERELRDIALDTKDLLEMVLEIGFSGFV